MLRGHSFFAPFSGSFSIKKRWIELYWQKLIDLQRLPVFIVGIDQQLPLKNCIDHRNKTTIHQLASLIKYCRLFVGLPSGPLWFANVYQKEAVVINGGYELPILTQYDRSHHFFINLECSLCNVEPKVECRNDMKCMKMITPEMINEKIAELLNTQIVRLHSM